VGRRLFQGLEQRVEGLAGQHVDFVDDVDLVLRAARSHVDFVPQFADFINPTVTGGVYFDDIQVRTVIIVWQVVDGMRQNPGYRGFADAAGTCKQVGMANTALFERLLESFGDMFLAYDFVKRPRTILSI
jgi:hypothetical protein